MRQCSPPGDWGEMRPLCSDYEIRIDFYVRALQEIATGLVAEDSVAGVRNRYEICAARLCGIARQALYT